MKRELACYGTLVGSWCCPKHDKWPAESFSSNRSKRARSRDKKSEHQLARTIAKRNLFKDLVDL